MEQDLITLPYIAYKDWFNMGGVFMYYIVLADIIVVLVIIAAFAICTPETKKMTVKIFAVVIFVPLLVGTIGHYLGYTQAVQAIAFAHPLEKEDMYHASMSVAKIPTIFGAFSSFILFLMGLIGLWFCKKIKR